MTRSLREEFCECHHLLRDSSRNAATAVRRLFHSNAPTLIPAPLPAEYAFGAQYQRCAAYLTEGNVTCFTAVPEVLQSAAGARFIETLHEMAPLAQRVWQPYLENSDPEVRQIREFLDAIASRMSSSDRADGDLARRIQERLLQQDARVRAKILATGRKDGDIEDEDENRLVRALCQDPEIARDFAPQIAVYRSRASGVWSAAELSPDARMRWQRNILLLANCVARSLDAFSELPLFDTNHIANGGTFKTILAVASYMADGVRALISCAAGFANSPEAVSVPVARELVARLRKKRQLAGSSTALQRGASLSIERLGNGGARINTELPPSELRPVFRYLFLHEPSADYIPSAEFERERLVPEVESLGLQEIRRLLGSRGITLTLEQDKLLENIFTRRQDDPREVAALLVACGYADAELAAQLANQGLTLQQIDRRWRALEAIICRDVVVAPNAQISCELAPSEKAERLLTSNPELLVLDEQEL